MAEVIQAADANAWSINRISQCFGMSRDTVTRRLRDAGVPASGKRVGHPIYALRDVAPALFAQSSIGEGDDGHLDPGQMMPKDRKDWFDSELKRIKYEQEIGQLMDADEVAKGVASVFKKIALSLDTIVDVIERDAGLDSRQLQIMQKIIDTNRALLAADISGGE